MANTTDPFANAVHGTNPQYLVEKITRLKIYNTVYWKEECFGLTAATLIDKAVELKYYGGTYGGNLMPTKFLCLLLKMLQLQPEKEIVYEFIQNEDFPYLRVLGAFYLRLTGKAEEIYTHLEPLYNDYRPVVMRSVQGFTASHMDEFVDALLREELVCDITLPHLIKRIKMEEMNILPPRRSLLEEELGEMDEESDHEAVEDEGENEEALGSSSLKEIIQEKEDLRAQNEKNADEGAAVTFEEEEGEEEEKKKKDERKDERKEVPQAPTNEVISERKTSSQLRDDNDDRQRHSESRHGSRSDERKERRRRSPSSDRDDRRYRSRRRSRSRSRSRGRRDSRDYDRRRRRDDSRDRKRRDRSRSRSRGRYSYSSEEEEEEDRQSRRRKERDEDDKRRKEDRYEEKSSQSSRKDEKDEEEDDNMAFSGANAAQKPNEKQKKNEKLFDKMFGKKKANSANGAGSKSNAKVVGKEVVGANGQKFVITAPEGTIEYWNQMREALGMKKLK